MDIRPVTLCGRVIRLEPLDESHVPDLVAAGQDESIWRYLPYGDLRSETAMRAWVRDLLARQARGTDLPFAIRHFASRRAFYRPRERTESPASSGCSTGSHIREGRTIGATRYMEIQPANRALEIGGTWYGVPWQRTAANTECKLLLLQHAFDVLGAGRVQFKTDLCNERSQHSLERIGAVREGVLRDHMILPGGRVRSSVYYSILAAEWPAVRARIETLLSSRA